MNNILNCNIEHNSPFGLVLTPSLSAKEITDLPITELRYLTRKHHLLILKGFHSNFTHQQNLIQYAHSWGEIMMWPFGAVLDVKENEEIKDHVFDSSYMPLHWDGMYKPTIPEFILFHCVLAPSADEGGRTILVDTSLTLKNLNKNILKKIEKINITYRIKKVSHYGGELCSPLITRHPVSNELVIRYNEPAIEGETFLNKHTIEFHNITQGQELEIHNILKEALYEPKCYYAHQWYPGDMIILDNFALLHGREGFKKHSLRHLQRIHIQSNPICLNNALKNSG